MILMFLYLFHVQPLWELNPNRAKSLGFKGIGEGEKKGIQKHQRRALSFVQWKSPPLSYFFFSFLSFHLALPSLCPPYGIVQVITSTLAHYHFTITCVVSSHREEKGEWGQLIPQVDGVVVVLPCIQLQ